MSDNKKKDALLVGGALLAAAVLAKPLFGLAQSGGRAVRLRRAKLYTLEANNVRVVISSMGGIIKSLTVPDAHGGHKDIVLGFDKLSDYIAENTYFGAVVGRVANRIAEGKLFIDGQEYSLATNNGPHHLHGGNKGWDKVIWKSRRFKHHEGDAVELTYTSKDGEEGYPGTVNASITYILQPAGNLKMVFEAKTDKATPVNMAQHSYFNLGGHDSGDILSHRLHIHGEHITPNDENQIPTGEFEPVQDTPFDFTVSRRIGNRIDEVKGGYDHNYVLFGMGRNAKFVTETGTVPGGPKLAAQLEDGKSGIVLKVLTNAPGLQFYTGNYLQGVKGKGGAVYEQHAGLCLETQGFPDAVNQSAFPSVLLQPDELYRHEVIYQFSIK